MHLREHQRRVEGVASELLAFEALAPTGDSDRGTGLGTWILAPGGALAFNPTDRFPAFVVGRYFRSVEGLGGDNREEEVAERPDLRVRSAELTLQTVHILPTGFFVSVIPSFFVLGGESWGKLWDRTAHWDREVARPGRLFE